MDRNDDIDGWVDDPRSLSTVVKELERQHAQRLSHDKGLLHAYYNMPSVTSERDPTRPASELNAYDAFSRVGFNKTAEVVDAGIAQVIEALKANVTPSGGDSRLEYQCRKLALAVDGVFDAVDFHDLATDATLDGATTTIGALHWYLDGGSEIRCQRLDPTLVFWDVSEDSDPFCIYTSMPFSRRVAATRWPKHKGAIAKAPRWTPSHIIGVDYLIAGRANTVRVDIGYYRGHDGQPGRSVMTCGDAVLEDHAWPHSFLPIVPTRWKPDFRGPGGVPLARAVAPYHHAINRQQRNIEESLVGCVPQLLVHEDDNSSTMSDMHFSRIVYSGARKPEVWTPNAVSPQAWEQVDRLSAGCYAETGVNAMAAQGNTRVGLNSAPAQREATVVAANRVQRQKREWRNLHIASAKCVVGLGAIAYKDKAQLVRAPGTSDLMTIKWSDIDLREDSYRIKFSESSGLSSTFAGRIEEIGELQARGAMSPAAATRALAHRMPDIAQAASRATAAEDLANRIVEEAKAEGKTSIAPSMDPECLKAVVTIGTQEWLRAQSDNTLPEHAEVLRRLIVNTKAKLQPPAPPPMPPAPPMDTSLPPPLPPGAMPPLPPDALPPMPEAPL